MRRVTSARTPLAAAESALAGGCAVFPEGCPKATRETKTSAKHVFDKMTALLLALMVPLL
jgi:hypothetical protein